MRRCPNDDMGPKDRRGDKCAKNNKVNAMNDVKLRDESKIWRVLWLILIIKGDTPRVINVLIMLILSLPMIP